MTKKTFEDSAIDQWFIELESIIRHEILSYIINCKVVDEGNFMWDALAFLNVLEVGFDCASEYLDKLLYIENDFEIIELENSVGSNFGLYQAEHFLEEKDFLIQVMDKNEFKELSHEAQERLTVTYPLAKETIKHYMKNLNGHELPSCLRSLKLNEDFRINNLGEDNNIADIVKFHLHLLDSKKKNKQIKRTKPQLITSIKKYKYIDIFPIQSFLSSENNRDLELIISYKWGVINELEEPYRSKILAYCNDLIQAYIKHLSNCNSNEDKLIPDYNSLPVPPPSKMYVTRYDGYLPLLIGLYCVKNEHRYKKVKNRELEVEFDSFRDFLEEDLYITFDYLRERYESWSKSEEANQVVDLKLYIDSVLSRRVRANIKSVKLLINEIEKEYF
ncbi:hypothetical protein REH76_00680 [Photobacterium damselae]